MSSYNKVILIGNITRSPDVKTSSTGILIAKGSLAINGKGKKKNEVTYINFTAFDKLADIVQLYVKKGDRVLVEGTLSVSQYTGKDGSTKTSTDVIAETIQNLSPKRSEGYTPIPQQALEEDDEIAF